MGELTAICLQWNCRGLRACWEELQLLLSDFRPLCVCLQETMVGGGPLPLVRGYSAFRSACHVDGGHSGGCAVYCRADVPVTRFAVRSALQVLAVQLHFVRCYTICCLYLPPSIPVDRRDLEGLVSQLPSPFILLLCHQWCQGLALSWACTCSQKSGLSGPVGGYCYVTFCFMLVVPPSYFTFLVLLRISLFVSWYFKTF